MDFFDGVNENRRIADQLRTLSEKDGLSEQVKLDIETALSRLYSTDQKIWRDTALNLLQDGEAETEAYIQRKLAREEARRAVADYWYRRLTRHDRKRRTLKKGPAEPSLAKTGQLQNTLDKIEATRRVEAMRQTNNSRRKRQPR